MPKKLHPYYDKPLLLSLFPPTNLIFLSRKLGYSRAGKMTLANGHYDGGQEYLEVRYNEAVARREVIERDKARGVLVRRLGWPAAMLTLMSLTGKKISCL